MFGWNFSRKGKHRYAPTESVRPGFNAFGDGVVLRACPHPRDSKEAEWWRYGWRWAWYQWKSKRKAQRRLGDYDAWPVDLPCSRHKIQA